MVERYLSKRFLERRDWEGVLANSRHLDDRGIPAQNGQYVKFTRKDRFRRPEHVNLSSETSDPASGAEMSTQIVQVPVEFIHEYISISTIAQMTSWIDLEQWADEDLPMALKRRMHELVQNAFIVGRMKPGRYDSSGDLTTPFDAEAEATVTLYGASFTFAHAPTYYANGRSNFSSLETSDRITWDDIRKVALKIKLAGGGNVVGYASSSLLNDLMHDGTDGEFFSYAIRNNAVGAAALQQNKVVPYAGVTLIEDDQPFTEEFGHENVRALNGPIHSLLLTSTAPKAVAYINWGNKKTQWKPTFKVQDISKTGKEKTIGYTVPFQAAVINPAWCAVIKAPVSEFTPNA